MTEGLKFDQDKPPFTLLPPHAELEVVRVLGVGAKKYGPDNWRKVVGLTERYLGAAMRHLNAYRSGEALDPETNLHHLAHAACSLMFIVENDIDA